MTRGPYYYLITKTCLNAYWFHANMNFISLKYQQECIFHASFITLYISFLKSFSLSKIKAWIFSADFNTFHFRQKTYRICLYVYIVICFHINIASMHSHKKTPKIDICIKLWPLFELWGHGQSRIYMYSSYCNLLP